MPISKINTKGLGDSSVTATKIVDGAVVASEIADGSITTAKIANDAVTSDKVATNAVIADGVAAGAIGTSELANNAVNTDKIGASQVITAKIADDAVTSAKLDTNLTVAGNLTVSGTFDSPSAWKLVDTQSGSSTSSGNVQIGTLSTSYKKHKIFYRLRFTDGGSSDTNLVYHYWGSGTTLRGGYTELGLGGAFANGVGHNGGYAHLGRAVASGSSGYDFSGEMLVTQSHASGTYKANLQGQNCQIRSGTGPVSAMHYSNMEGLTSFTQFYVNADESAGSGVVFTYDVEVYGWN